MIETPHSQPNETGSRFLKAWAIGATVVALVSISLAVFFFFQAHGPFLDLAENTIPGTYKWIGQGGDQGFITLNADYSFSKDGSTIGQHRWKTTRDALVIFWLKKQNRFNKIERPGVYVEVQDGREITRMEKQGK